MEHRAGQFYRGPVGVLLEPVVRRLRGRGLAHRHRVVRKAHRALWRATRSNRVQIDGHDLELDMGDSAALAKGWYEVEETRWYDENVSPGDFVVEVGANLGYFTLRLARTVGPGGRVLCYEPDPEVGRILARNVEVNHYDNVVVRRVAVADRPREMTFYRARKNTGDNRLFTHGDDAGSFPVPVVALDDELAGESRGVDLLKMDIQGAEPLALRGMERTLSSAPPRRMVIEFWPHGIVGMGGDPAELVRWILGFGYRVSLLDGRTFDLDEALRTMTVENEKWVNLLFVHSRAEDRA